MESIIFTTDASIVLAELLGGIRHENLFIVADKHTVGFCDRLFEKVDWIPSHVTVLDCGEEYKSVESVCPKFNTLRSPCSLGSWETISSFIVTERRISSRKSSGLVS